MTVPKGSYDNTKRRYGTVKRDVWYCHVEKFDNSLFPIVHVLNIDNQKENIFSSFNFKRRKTFKGKICFAAVIQYAKTKQTAIEARQLRSWCLERNLPHASLYKLAVGQSVPTFKAISYLVPYFAPAEWLFFTDKEIPYPIRTLPEWNPDDTSVFIQQHKKDWKQTAQKYGIEEENARNIFVNRRANFTLMQMWRMAGNVNPEVRSKK